MVSLFRPCNGPQVYMAHLQHLNIWACTSTRGPFRFLEDHPQQNQRAFQKVKSVDICFCLSNCDATVPSYFKVGELPLTPLRLSASSLFLQVPRREGLGLELTAGEEQTEMFLPAADSIHPAGAHADVLVKLLADNNLTKQDADCASVPYSTYYESSSEHYQLLSLRTDDISVDEMQVQSFFRSTLVGDKMVFNSSDYSLSMLRPGRVALCYCGDDGSGSACSTSTFWRLILHFTVRGPRVGDPQEWIVSQGVIFSLRVDGWGLLATDMIQVLSQDEGSCNSDLSALILVGCPSHCRQQNETGQNGTQHDSRPKEVSSVKDNFC